MTQEEIYEIVSKVHEDPAYWLSNLRRFDAHQLAVFACGCETLLLHDLTPLQVRGVLERYPQVVDSLLAEKYDCALRSARAIVSQEYYKLTLPEAFRDKAAS
jgi:hypothetical protein